MTALLLAIAAVVLTALTLLPGTLGILKYTHKFTAQPLGARYVYVWSVPLYFLGLGLLAAAVWQAATGQGPLLFVLLAAAVVVALSVMAFLMHTRFMFKPIEQPLYLSAEEAVDRFGETEEVVGVVDPAGVPYAYVARLARRPHIVFQSEGEAPFLMSHCILSHSSMGYALDERFTAERIHISSVLANNLVFYDHTNGCTVLQIENRSRDGEMELATLPTLMASLATWRRVYPESKVWYRPKEWRDTFYLKLLARASIIDPESPDLLYPLHHGEPDPRLPLKAFVMGVDLGGESRAYAAELFREHRLIEDTLGGRELVFFASEGGDLVPLFERRLPGGEVASFRTNGGETFVDEGTGSTWDLRGHCVNGSLAGQKLNPIPHYNKIFWCVWADYFPATGVYEVSVGIPPGER